MQREEIRDDNRFRSSIEDLRRSSKRALLFALPLCLVGLAYVGLLVSYWSGAVAKDWVAGAALVLIALLFVTGILAFAGSIHYYQWRCPACGASVKPPGYLWWGRPLRWWMFLPVAPRACKACGVSFTDAGKRSE
jgi:hypothetical protein